MECSDFYYCTKCLWNKEDLANGKCLETCGDGYRYFHECDDGNTDNGDGCNSNCQIEVGFDCSGGDADNRDICIEKCDGIYLGKRECDVDHHACVDCQIKEGY